MNLFFAVFSFWFGSMIGSFLNMYIHRTCKNEEEGTTESITFPKRSYCPSCKKQIAWYDNLPLLSYIMLWGKCRQCKSRISFRYFTVELICSLMTLLLFIFYAVNRGNYPMFFISIFFTYAMIALTFIDIKVMIIPDEISLGGIVLGLIISVIYPKMHIPIAITPFFQEMHPALNSLFASLIGFLAGGGLLYFIGLLGYFLFKKEAMGGGDIKLLAMMGSFLGWRSIFLIIFMASLLGTLISLFFIIIRKRQWADQIPFGPFLAVSAVLVMCFQKEILAYLFGTFF